VRVFRCTACVASTRGSSRASLCSHCGHRDGASAFEVSHLGISRSLADGDIGSGWSRSASVMVVTFQRGRACDVAAWRGWFTI
jgi:hypothetical protein